MIAPIFENLSKKYPQAVFLKVDVDECDSVAAANGVSITIYPYLKSSLYVASAYIIVISLTQISTSSWFKNEIILSR